MSASCERASRLVKPRMPTAHWLELMRATWTPGARRRASTMLVAPARRMSSAVTTWTAAGVRSACARRLRVRLGLLGARQIDLERRAPSRLTVYRDVASGLGVRMRRHISLVQFDVAGLDAPPSTSGHCVPRVDHQVHAERSWHQGGLAQVRLQISSIAGLM